jgi:hypothetical protein
LPFWPQFADHLMWGALLGATLCSIGKGAGLAPGDDPVKPRRIPGVPASPGAAGAAVSRCASRPATALRSVSPARRCSKGRRPR